MRRNGFVVTVILVIIGSVLASGCIGGWDLGRKIEGKMHSIGNFNASSLMIEDVVGDVIIEQGSSNRIQVKTTLPLKYRNESLLVLYCPKENGRNKCNDYKNGIVVIKTGRSMKVIIIRDTVGEIENTVNAVNFNASDVVGRFRLNFNTSSLNIRNIVGDMKFVGSLKRAEIENIVGKVELTLESAREISIKDVVGDIDVKAPSDAHVSLHFKDSINLKLDVDENIYNGTEPLEIGLHNIIGKVKIGK